MTDCKGYAFNLCHYEWIIGVLKSIVDVYVLSIYVHLFQPSNPATELQNEGILSSQYIAENQQSQQNRATNKKKKEIVEISID